MLLGNPVLAIQEPDVVICALKRYRESRKVQFADCLILETARKAGQRPLATFDVELATLDGSELVG
jgi:predicted nucleic-acid-binding protein